MIVCSCQTVSDFDIELALLDILNQPEAPIPTPGVVYRHMQKRMQCCGCAPLAVDVIYAKLEDLERRGLRLPVSQPLDPRAPVSASSASSASSLRLDRGRRACASEPAALRVQHGRGSTPGALASSAK